MQEPKKVQFDIENTTNEPISINLFDSSSITPISDSSSFSSSSNNVNVSGGGFLGYNVYDTTSNLITFKEGNQLGFFNPQTGKMGNGIVVNDNSQYSQGFNPAQPTITAPNGLFYCADNDNGVVRVIDSATNNIINTIYVGAFTFTSYYCNYNGLAYFTDDSAGITKVFVIDTNTNTLLTTLDLSILPNIGRLGFFSFNPNNNNIYISSSAFLNDYIVIIDADTNTFSQDDLGTSDLKSNCIVVNTSNNSLYFETYDNTLGTTNITVYDCNTNTITTNIELFAGSLNIDDNGVYCPVNNCVYFFCIGINSVYVIDCNTNTLIDTILITTLATTSYNIIYSSIDNSVYVPTSSIGGSSFDTLQKIDCVTNAISTINLNVGSSDLINSAQSTLNGNIYVYSETQDIVSVFNSTGAFVTNITGVGSVGAGNRSAIIYIAFYDMIVCYTDAGLIYIGCNQNTIFNTVVIPHNNADSYNLKYDELSGLLYVISLNSATLISKINLFTSPTILEETNITNTNSSSLVTKTDNIYSNFVNKNYLQVAFEDGASGFESLIFANNYIYGVGGSIQPNTLFRYNIQNSNFDRNQKYSDYFAVNYFYCYSNNNIYSVIADFNGQYCLRVIDSESLIVKRNIPLNQFTSASFGWGIAYPIPQKNILILTSSYIVFILNLDTLDIIEEIDYNALGYLNGINSVSYSTQDDKIILSNGGQNYFFINANNYSVSVEYVFGNLINTINYCELNNQFYGLVSVSDEVLVIDSSLESITTTISSSNQINSSVNNSNLIFTPINNLIYAVGNDGSSNGTIDYINPLTNTIIFTDTLTQLTDVFSIAYDSTTNSVYLGGLSSTNSTFINVNCINPLTQTPVYTSIVTQSKVLETATNDIQGMTTSSLNGYTYISSQSQDTISVFDENNLFVTEISIFAPYKLIYVESLNYVYVIQPSAPTTDISVINCNTNTIINTLTLTDVPQNLLFNELDGKIYVSCDNNLIRVNNDLSSATSYANSLIFNSAIALNTLDNLIYISGGASDSLFVFDCNTLSFTTPITVVSGISNPNLIFNDNNNYLYTFDNNTNLYVIDTLTNTLISTNVFKGDIGYSNYNIDSSVLTNDNYLVFSYVNGTVPTISFLLFFNCDTNVFDYSRFIESVATGTNLNVTQQTGLVNGITFSTFDDSLRILGGNDTSASTEYGQNFLTLMKLSKQETTYNVIGITSETNISINEIDTDFNYGTGTLGGWTDTSLVLDDNSIYYGGNFTSWNGTPCNNIVRVLSDGFFDSSFVQGAGFNDIVFVIKKQLDNKIIVGGDFTSYDGNSCNNICRLNSDGSFDSTFNTGTGFNSRVDDLIILPSGKVVCVGDFTSFNSNLTNCIVGLNSDGSFDSTFNVGTGFDNGGIGTTANSIVSQSNGKLLVGGVFLDYNGNSCNNICRLNSDGSFDSTFNTGTGFNNEVLTIYIKVDDKILVGGTFTDFDGNVITRYVQLNSDGSFDSNFNLITTVSNNVNVFNVDSNGLIYVGYGGNSFGGASDNGLAVLFPSGELNSFIDYSTILPFEKYTIDLTSDNKIYLSGDSNNARYFNTYTYNSLSINQKENIANFSSATFFILNNNGKLLVGGDFSQYGNIISQGLIQLNLDGSYDETFNVGTGVIGTLFDCKTQSDGKIIIVGNFNSYDGNPCGFICRLNTDGSFDNTFITGTGFDLFTYTLDIQSDDKIIVGGVFGFYDGNVCNRICRLNSDGSFDNTFVTGTGFDDTVKTLQIYNDKIYLGGSFVVYDGNPCNKICRLNLDGSFDSTFNIGTGFNDIIFKINVVNDKVYVVGQMTTYQTFNIGRIVRLNLDASYDNTFSTSNVSGTGFNGTVTCVFVSSDNKVYLGGLFTTYMGVSTENFACLDTNGNILRVFDYTTSQGFNNEVLFISEINNNIYVGGDFTSFQGNSAKFCLELNSNSNIINDLYEIDVISNIFWDETYLTPISYYSYQNQYQFGKFFSNYLNSYLYVSFVNSNLIQVLDVNNNYSLVTSLSLPVSGNVIDFALNPENNTLALGMSTFEYNLSLNYFTPNYGLPTLGSLVLLNSQTNTISQVLNSFNNAGVNYVFYSPTTGNFIYGGNLYSDSNSSFLSFATPSSSFTIEGGSVDYNFFVQGLNNDPKKIEEIELIMPQRYLANPVNVQYLDASGISDLKPFLPNTEIDAFQKATNRAVVKFGNEYVMNINTQIVNFILPPLSTTTMIITYTELIKSDMLDVVIYEEERKAKYTINQSLDGKITAKKYWGNKKMPKELSLNSDWLKEMRERFQKVEVIEYDQPKLAGGTIQTKDVYQDLFGFSKQVKAKHIGITKTPKFKKGVKVKLATKKKPIKPVAEDVQVEEVFQDILRVNAHEIPLEKIIPMEMPIDKQPIKPRPVEMTTEQVFQEMLSVNAHEIKLNKIKVPKIKGVKPIQVQLDDLSPIDVFNRSFEDYGSGYLVGVKTPCKEEERKDKFDYGVYYIKPNDERYTAFRHSGDFPIKIELTTDWFNDLKRIFDDIQVIAIVKRKK